jgi:hypothetical protein
VQLRRGVCVHIHLRIHPARRIGHGILCPR